MNVDHDTMDVAQIAFDCSEHGSGKRRVQLGTFTHGQLKRERVELSRLQMYEEQGPSTKKRQIMAAETSSMTYVGKNFDENNNDGSERNSTYVGAFCPKTGKMEVFEVDLFTITPHLPEFDEDQADDTNKTSENMSYMEQQELLTSAFGSKRSKLAAEARKKTKVDDTSLKTILKSTIVEGQAAAIATQQKLDDLMNSDDTILYYLPPCNKAATKTEDIFDISKIITEEEMADLTGPAQELFDCDMKKLDEWRKSQKYPVTVLNHLENLPSSSDRRLERCKYLLYQSYMMTFMKMSASHVTNQKEIFPVEWPRSVKKRLQEQFTEPPPIDASFSQKVKCKRSYSAKQQNKLLSHIMVLGLILNNYVIKAQELIKDTNIGLRRILDQTRLIRFSAHNTKNVELCTITLEAPLTFGPTAGAKPKKRK